WLGPKVGRPSKRAIRLLVPSSLSKDAFILLHRKRSTMKSLEPVFDFPGEFCAAGPSASEADIRVLEDTIASQSSELNLRLTAVLDLYNMQARQTDALQAAREEIDHLKRTVLELRAARATK